MRTKDIAGRVVRFLRKHGIRVTVKNLTATLNRKAILLANWYASRELVGSVKGILKENQVPCMAPKSKKPAEERKFLKRLPLFFTGFVCPECGYIEHPGHSPHPSRCPNCDTVWAH